MKQTLAFLESKVINKDHMKQWSILIQVLIEQKQESEKRNEWEQCLDVIKSVGLHRPS